MQAKYVTALALALAAPVALAQAKGQASNGAALASGTKINAVLKSKLDTRHAKVGDRVTGQTTAAVKQGGTVVLPKGSKLYGRVTQVSRAANSKSRATLGVLFYQAVTPKGVPMPMHAAITGLTAARSMARFHGDGGGFGAEGDGGMMAEPMTPMVGAAGGGGVLGGVSGGVGGALGGAVDAAAPMGGAAAGGLGAMGSGAVQGAGGGAGAAGGMLRASHGALFSASNGALFSIRPLPSAAAASRAGAATSAGALGARGAGGSGTLLTSQGGDLRFDSGSHMQLQESGPGGVGAGAGGGARARAGAGGGR